MKLKRNFDELEEDKIEEFDPAQWPKYLGALKVRMQVDHDYVWEETVGPEKCFELKKGDPVELRIPSICFRYHGNKNSNWSISGKDLRLSVYHNKQYVNI